MTTIEKILAEEGPLMSSILAKKISEIYSIPINTASQRVARDKNIKKIKGFFISNQSLCYLDDHIKNELLFEAFRDSLYNHGRKYWYCFNALKLNQGIISKNYLECYTNYPILPLKGHLPFNEVMRNFIINGILIFNGSEYFFSPKFTSQPISSFFHRALETIKNEIINNFNSFVKNIGLISYNSGEIFGEYGKFRWSLKGVSNITGLIKEGKPGFLLADILIGSPVFENDILFFIEKIKHIQSYRNAPRLIPFLITDYVDKKALDLLKKHGIVIGLIHELFGQKYADNIRELLTILSNAGASLKKTPEKYLDLISELKKYNEGLINNIRGTLFEYLVGHIHSLYCQSINIGWEIIDFNSRHEMDVIAVYQEKVVIAECKALKSMVDLEMIDKWFDKKIPAFKLWFDKQETYKKKKLEFEYWSTSGFTENALEKLERNPKINKSEIHYFQPKQIREKAIQMDNKKLKEVLDNFFLKISV